MMQRKMNNGTKKRKRNGKARSVYDIVAGGYFWSVYGARPLRRALYELVEDKLAEMILRDELKSGDSIKISALNDEIVVNLI